MRNELEDTKALVALTHVSRGATIAVEELLSFARAGVADGSSARRVRQLKAKAERHDAVRPARKPPPRPERLRKAAIIGWSIELAGMALWLYGYFATGNPPLVDWKALTPWWIADFLPNIECEIGMILVIAGIVPLYWPKAKRWGPNG